MEPATEQIAVLVTRQEKERIATLASEAGISMGEFLRQAAQSFRSEGDAEVPVELVDQLLKTSARASDAIDEAFEVVEASNKRMAALGCSQN